MKANELMIGDWVRWEYFDNEPKERIVYGINKEDDIVYVDFGDGEVYKDVEPIPLTEEILKANGFVAEEEFEHCVWGDCNRLTFDDKKGYIEICFRDSFDTMTSAGTETTEPSIVNILVTSDIGNYDSTRVGKPFYVHELQRALRCCGLFDLANNFKI